MQEEGGIEDSETLVEGAWKLSPKFIDQDVSMTVLTGRAVAANVRITMSRP